jgi:hypothetical protein
LYIEGISAFGGLGLTKKNINNTMVRALEVFATHFKAKEKLEGR